MEMKETPLFLHIMKNFLVHSNIILSMKLDIRRNKLILKIFLIVNSVKLQLLSFKTINHIEWTCFSEFAICNELNKNQAKVSNIFFNVYTYT